MARDFSKLGQATAAKLNAGMIGVQKDKVVYLDPTTEILYDPQENIRNNKVVDDSIEGLIELRLTMDGSEQLQPIRVFPLDESKLDPSKPAMKYGIAYGHRRTLSCRLTTADHPDIGPKPRKVAAIIDTDWLQRGRSYRLRCQIHENTAKVDLNPVELGQALKDYQTEYYAETGDRVTQAHLMAVFGLREKTVYSLLKAAEFHDVAKKACHSRVLTDLDTLVTFDVICKTNEELGEAIYNSLQVEGAPNNRGLIRQARVLAEDPSYQFDAATWVWPDSVSPETTQQPAQATAQQSVSTQPAVSSQPVTTAPAARVEGQTDTDVGSTQAKPAGKPEPETMSQPSSLNTAQSTSQAAAVSEGINSNSANQPAAPVPSSTAEAMPPVPVVIVEFKMGSEADNTFTGELLLNEKPKSSNAAVVAYLNEEGREEKIDVPLKHISLVSINHK